jgi:hypothetical protein
MSVAVEIAPDSSLRDRVLRRRISLTDPDVPKQKALVDLHRYWETLRVDGKLPSRAQFDITRLKAVMGATSIVEVAGETPENFRYRLVGTQIPLPMTLSNRTIDALRASEPFFRGVEQDYLAARDLSTPLYHEVMAVIDYVTYSYARLILPFAADGETVNQLLVSSVHQEFPDLVRLAR